MDYKLTPILVVFGLFLGSVALYLTPAEEDPQIPITMVHISTNFIGATASEVEMRVTTPLENFLSKVSGVKHIYSKSSQGSSSISLEFHLGEYNTESVFKVYEIIHERIGKLPSNITQPIITAMEIDDVPSLVYSLYSETNNYSRTELKQFAQSLKVSLSQIKDIRQTDIITGVSPAVRISLDTHKMDFLGIDSQIIKQKIQAENSSSYLLKDIQNNKINEVWIGEYLELNDIERLKNLLVGFKNKNAIYLKDVTKEIKLANDLADTYVNYYKNGKSHPSVTLTVSKKPLTSAISLEKDVRYILEDEMQRYLPKDLKLDITRNYAKSASSKVNHLTQKLLIVIGIVMLLVLVTMGYRFAIIVATSTLVTLALTLFASMVMGFTFNQVSLFALIFSIGILVDDAIVVVENVHRYQLESNESIRTIIPKAISEVGQPTIIATLAVTITLLPMVFVTGLMGPYMSPIPINASVGMLISLLIAFTVTPWLLYKFSAKHTPKSIEKESSLNFFICLNMFFLKTKFRQLFLIFIISGMVFSSFLLVTNKLVVLKMLPHDNKMEMQLEVKLPSGSALEATTRLLNKIALDLSAIPEISSQQLYAGRSGPINFNGMVRSYQVRRGSHKGDIQISLTPKSMRERSSHEIAGEVRKIVSKYLNEAHIKIVEVPPGPPVLSPILAEIYEHDTAKLNKLTRKVESYFKDTEGICDIDTKLVEDRVKSIIVIDAKKSERYGISIHEINQHIKVLSSEKIGYIHNARNIDGIPIIMSLKDSEKSLDSLLQSQIKGIFLYELVEIKEKNIEAKIYHKDRRKVNYVSADVLGENESPLYGMFEISQKIKDIEQHFISTPLNINAQIKWSGEWRITYETFRDMGLAYLVGIIFLYLLLINQYNSYLVPLVIMSPIPLTIIGVLPGHYFYGSAFTATSMIGMIALAGIIVRNSVLLIDFIQDKEKEGFSIDEAVIQSVKIRTKPIMITAITAVLGSLFILSDPVFEGMAVSLISGVFIGTILTLLVIPILYKLTSSNKLSK
ncbi:MAG: Acriflavin resistance protein [uncultured Sulfurovum sp.]|uniref:Acriflavin resistance protein n=1 Tax=uncultured Sulfurovum sp. TaxID=269237 RepID=A0A6S6SX05_9BACT|nr:MAG: Acriflavin resistance protein [uncultured Sulfurovum sp.]